MCRSMSNSIPFHLGSLKIHAPSRPLTYNVGIKKWMVGDFSVICLSISVVISLNFFIPTNPHPTTHSIAIEGYFRGWWVDVEGWRVVTDLGEQC
jgi:hypothetical protein